jgi:AraC-like DNA-binding protein/ligand-binding sensor protein
MGGSSDNEGEISANRRLIDKLRRSKLFRDYERVFSEATGLPLGLRPVEYWQLSHRGKKHENPFCALLAENPKSLAVCLQSHEDMVRRTSDIPTTVTCPFGLTETAVPLKLGTRTIGYLRVGQVLRRSPSRADTAKVEQTMKRIAVPFSAKIRQAWDKNPVLPPERYGAIVRLLTFFAEQLSALTNQLVVEEQNQEPLLVTKARQFIAAHRTEQISLASVAAAAGASVFHFSKVFHKSTGVTFTDYLGRVRAEDARHRLLNPNLRISEVAFDCGFQSLTQFNRTFKRVFGQSPSAFRDGLHSGTSPVRRRAAK